VRAADAQRSALNHVLNKKSWLAALVGTTIGAGALYLLQSIPLIALIPFPFAGTVSVACYGFALRQSVSIAVGVVLGLQTGILMSVLVIIWTIVVTGVGHYEFAAAVFYAPFIICILSVLGASVTAFFVRRPV
jgi:hypothetical protein